MIPDNTMEKQAETKVEAVHLRKAGNSKAVVIPRDLFSVLNWRDGELLILYAFENHVLIKPLDRKIIRRIEEYGEKTEPVN